VVVVVVAFDMDDKFAVDVEVEAMDWDRPVLAFVADYDSDYCLAESIVVVAAVTLVLLQVPHLAIAVNRQGAYNCMTMKVAVVADLLDN
jgi:hypothetical protein